MPNFDEKDYWRSILLFGLNTATYKIALGKSLIYFARNDKSQVTINELAEHFFDLYLERLKNGMPQLSRSDRMTKMERYVNEYGLKLMSDNGSQPISLSFMKACSNLEVEQVFTSYNNPKGNADTERMIRTMKEELFWLREWTNERGLSLELNKWVEYYNKNYLHSAHGYSTPIQAEVEYYSNHNRIKMLLDRRGAVQRSHRSRPLQLLPTILTHM